MSAEDRDPAVQGMVLGAVLSIPLSLVLMILDLNGPGPNTWWGWSVAGFVLGLVPTGSLGWVSRWGFA